MWLPDRRGMSPVDRQAGTPNAAPALGWETGCSAGRMQTDLHHGLSSARTEHNASCTRAATRTNRAVARRLCHDRAGKRRSASARAIAQNRPSPHPGGQPGEVELQKAAGVRAPDVAQTDGASVHAECPRAVKPKTVSCQLGPRAIHRFAPRNNNHGKHQRAMVRSHWCGAHVGCQHVTATHHVSHRHDEAQQGQHGRGALVRKGVQTRRRAQLSPSRATRTQCRRHLGCRPSGRQTHR